MEPLVTVDDDAVVVTAVKLADDESGDVIVRFHESRGGRAKATLRAGFPVAEVVPVDLLERPTGEPQRQGDGIPVTLRPFELVTLRLKRA
ncbi:glycosyl hydrolase-related protein [Nonomuraea rubra]|uniref:glycosyl hydrolase-related protein n=1 Tax=Nonomuraea rubra TaxID=46180 RepID=UPI0036D3A964